MPDPLTTFNPYSKRNNACFAGMAALAVVGLACVLVIALRKR